MLIIIEVVGSNQREGELDLGLHPSGLKQEHLECFDIDTDLRKQDKFHDGVDKDFRYEVEVLHGSIESLLGIEGSRVRIKFC